MRDIPGVEASLQSPSMMCAVIIRACIIAACIAQAIRHRVKAKAFSPTAFAYTYATIAALVMGDPVDYFLFTLVFFVTHPSITEYGVSDLHPIWLSPAIGVPFGVCLGLRLIRRDENKTPKASQTTSVSCRRCTEPLAKNE